jgi:hypothetical protein
VSCVEGVWSFVYCYLIARLVEAVIVLGWPWLLVLGVLGVWAIYSTGGRIMGAVWGDRDLDGQVDEGVEDPPD